MSHPGKKLNFMGYEIAQFSEWNYKTGIDFFLKEYDKHRQMTEYVKELNRFYKGHKPLYDIETDWKGFEWLVVDDVINNVLVFNRYDGGGNCLCAIINFSGIDQTNYTFGQHAGKYKVAFNSDAARFGGGGKFNKRIYNTKKRQSHGKENSLTVDIPKLACLYLIKEK